MIWLLIGYMWLFIHRPFEIWAWLSPMHIERVFMLITIAFWATQPKRWIPCRSHFPVFLLAITYLIGSQTSPYASFATVEDWFKVLVFYFLIATTVWEERQFRKLIVGCALIVSIYELHSLREYFNGRGHYEMGTWRMIGVDVTMSHSNTFGASVAYTLPILYPVWTFAMQRWQKVVVFTMAALAVTCVLLTGSRSSFAALLALLVLVSLTSKYRWRILGLLLLVPPLVWAYLSVDLRNRYMTLIDPSLGPENAQASAEGRSKSFWYGVESFTQDPLFGAGLGSYRAKKGVGTHNLYNQAFGELGMFGLAVLIGFAWSFAGDFREAHRLIQDCDDPDKLFLYRVCLASFISCLLLFFLGWGGHNLTRYNWLWFGAFSGIALQILKERMAAFHDQCQDDLL